LAATIALLTDFGNQDPYVGMMKGVIASIAPQAKVIDLTHAIPPGNINRGAFELWQSAPFFPPGTVFVAVVDPGVGTIRRQIAIAWPDKICVGPDNGIFTYLLATEQPVATVELTNRAYHLKKVSTTFHGRDIFAPAAAYLAHGLNIEELGPPAIDLIHLPLPHLEMIDDETVQGRILHADRFGNFITNIGLLKIDGEDMLIEPWLPFFPPTRFKFKDAFVPLPNGADLRLGATFGDVAPGEPVAYIGSSGMLEIAVNQGRAADSLPMQVGQELLLVCKG
jgi:S-adenosylmethionine hydrolase